MPRPNPFIMVQDTSETVDYKLVSGNVEEEKERRLALGDDDLLKVNLAFTHTLGTLCKFLQLLFPWQVCDLVYRATFCQQSHEQWTCHGKLAG